jgi:hypothetical protein
MLRTHTLLALQALTTSAIAARTQAAILDARKHQTPFCDVEAAREAADATEGHLLDYLLATASYVQNEQMARATYLDEEVPY